jgi:tetratricopeptide (TPR) repeat protein
MKILITVALALCSVVCLNAQTVQEGLRHLENDNLGEALRIFTTLSEKEPSNADLYYYIGEVRYAHEDYQGALESYAKGLKINPDNALNNIGIGKLSLDKGDPAQAEKYFNLALKNAKDKSGVHSHIGAAYLRSRQPIAEKAVEHLTIARDLDPKKAAKHYVLLGDANALKGDHGNAMTNYEIAVEKDPSLVNAYLSMARIWSSGVRDSLAIENLKKAIQIDPGYAPAYKDLYTLYVKNKQYDLVLPVLEKYVTLIGDDVEARVRLVRYLTFQAKDYERAIKEGEALLATHPEQYTLHRWLAWAYAEAGEYQHSYDHSNMLFDQFKTMEDPQVFPSDYDYWARAAFELKLVEDAAHIYRKYLELDSTRRPEIYGKLAKAYYDAKKYDQAIIYYNKKQEVEQLANTEQFYLGVAHYYDSTYAQADSVFNEILAKSPEYAAGWLWRAKIANVQDPERSQWLAQPYYEKYIEVAGTDKEKNKKGLIEAHNYVAFYSLQHDDNESAIKHYELLLELDPGNAQVTQNLRLLKQ